MDINTLKVLYDYTYWAHGRVWGCALKLTEEQYKRELSFSWGSVHKQFVHIMGAEWIWLSRLKGTSPSALLHSDDYPTREDVKAKWQTIEADVRTYLNTLTPAELERDFTYRNTKGEQYTVNVGKLLLHVVNHGTDHRAQIFAMIHQMGGETLEQDLITYLLR